MNRLLIDDFYSLTEREQSEIYREFYKLVYPFVYSMIIDYTETEDVVQESFIRVISKRPKKLTSQNAKSWVFTVTRNVALNYLRKLNKNREHLKNSYVNHDFHEKNLTVEQIVFEETMITKTFMDCSAQLKEESRKVLELRVLHDFSYEEIANTLNVSVGSVRQRLARSRKIMRKVLKKEWFFEL